MKLSWTYIKWRYMKNEIKVFVLNLKNEARETSDAMVIISKYTRGEKITAEEESALKEQFFDVLKAAGIGVPIILIPGGSVLLPIISIMAKKHKINLLPSSFKNKESDENRR